MIHARRPGSRGFTLIEVLIAMLVVALGMGALMATLSASANAISRMRDKSFAQWIALNQISNVRLSGSQPGLGVTFGTEEFAGAIWRWQQEITDPGSANMVRVEVRVTRQDQDDESASVELGDAPMPSMGSAFGFLSTAVQRPSGMTPDWSDAAAQPGTPGGRGEGGEDSGGTPGLQGRGGGGGGPNPPGGEP
jgi:general secretion pathway protein I